MKRFIIPEFGFVAARDAVRSPGESRPQSLYASRVYFAEYELPQHEGQSRSGPEFKINDHLSSPEIQLATYYSRFGKLALVNGGIIGRGFRICEQCGFAEMAPEPLSSGSHRKKGQAIGHTNPRTGKSCSGYISTHLWWLHGISAEQIASLSLQLPCALAAIYPFESGLGTCPCPPWQKLTDLTCTSLL